MPQACVGQARGTGLRPRSLRIDRSRCAVGLNWEYQPHLATYATMCLTEVEREFCPASPDSRWDPLTRYLTLIVPGVSVTWWCDALGAATGRQRTCGFPNTRTASDLCHVYGSLGIHHLILTVMSYRQARTTPPKENGGRPRPCGPTGRSRWSRGSLIPTPRSAAATASSWSRPERQA